MREQPTLAMEPAAITCQRSVRADQAMAWHDNGNRIGAVRQSDRAHSVRPADRRRERAITHRMAGGDASQRGPHVALKGRTICFNLQFGDGIEIAAEIAAQRPRGFRRTPSAAQRYGAGAVTAAQEIVDAAWAIIPIECAGP